MPSYACHACGLIGPRPYCPKHPPERSPSSKATGRRDWRTTRARILTRDAYRCHWCPNPATQVDHLTPVSRGGTDHHTNLVASCASCNATRGNRA